MFHPVQSPTSWPLRQVPGYEVMVIGAGLAGAAVARILAAQAGMTVLVVDPRRQLAELGDEVPPALVHPSSLPPAAGRRRRAAAFLAPFARCAPCRADGIACIHQAEAGSRLVEALLDHPGIELLLGCDITAARQGYGHDLLVFTGRLDAFYDGRLGWLREAADAGSGRWNEGCETLQRRYEQLAVGESVTFVGERPGFAGTGSEQIVASAMAACERILAAAGPGAAAGTAEPIASAA